MFLNKYKNFINSKIQLDKVVMNDILMNSENKNPFASFHIRQALGLSLTFISFGAIISNFDSFYITFPMWICISILWTFGIFNAIQGQMRPIPLVGNLFQKWFKSIG